MKIRTLITQRLYFGMDAMHLRAGMERVLARFVGLPAGLWRISAQHLKNDFSLDANQAQELVDAFLRDGLLKLPDDKHVDFRLTGRFVEYASARVVEPLTRDRARVLLHRACELAAQINAEWKRNPLEIAVLAPFGCYMTRDEQLEELPLGVVLRPRASSRQSRWTRMTNKLDGAREIRAAMRELSSFVRVRMFNDMQMLPRPFSVAFEDRSDDDYGRAAALPPVATESGA